MASPHLTQFRQRVIASCHLSALTAGEARQYIEYRLTKVGWANDPRFSDDAFKEIYDHTGGIPRRINLLCSRLLLLGYLEEKHEIDAAAVANVAEELASELRPLSADRASEVLAQAPLPSGPNRTAQNGDALLSRIAELESTAARQDWLMVRVLDLALKYFARTER